MLEQVKGKVIISCQALENEPLHSSFIMGRMALAVAQGGAAGIRANSVADIEEIRKQVDLPIVGIIKHDYPDSEIYITATSKEVDALLETNIEMIALDATDRKRPGGETTRELVTKIHEGKKLAMADISNVEEGIKAEKVGFDCVSTTLSGYTPYTKTRPRPDFELLEQLRNAISIPIICEGHITEPAEVAEAFKRGAYSVVIGSAITRPQEIAKRFTDF